MNRSKEVFFQGVKSRPAKCLWAVIVAAAGMALSASPEIRAAELRLRDRCEVAGAVVTLADVARIFTGDAGEGKQLAAIELFPAPPDGQTRFVRQREIEDLLALRGVNLLRHQFSGANQVQIARRSRSPDRAVSEPAVAASVVRRAERLLREAIVEYLAHQVSQDEPWSVEVRLDERRAEAISAAGDKISVGGGQAPWTGQQQFEVTVDSPKGRAQFGVSAAVALPPAVAVSLRSLPRGAVIQPGDVGLQRSRTLGEKESDVFLSIDELLGSETTRAIPAGKVVQHGFVRPPLLVRRGQVVTVHARSSGIRVRTTARARDDGSLGDLVAVESLLDRTAYFVRVCGIREVEVYARSVRAAEERPRNGGGAHWSHAPSGERTGLAPAATPGRNARERQPSDPRRGRRG